MATLSSCTFYLPPKTPITSTAQLSLEIVVLLTLEGTNGGYKQVK